MLGRPPRTAPARGRLPDDAGAERATTVDTAIAKPNAILHPDTLWVKDVCRNSVYEVAHRLTDRFDDDVATVDDSRTPRVFIAGDACHTHSAQASQGMNVSMQDGFNPGWKLAHVLERRSPDSLLETYSTGRQTIAQDLIASTRNGRARWRRSRSISRARRRSATSM